MNDSERKLIRNKLRDNLMFLRGMLEGMSFFSETPGMADALESAQNQLDVISEVILENIE